MDDITALQEKLAVAGRKLKEATAKREEWSKAVVTAALGSDEAKKAKDEEQNWKDRETHFKEQEAFYIEKIEFLKAKKADGRDGGPETKRLLIVSDAHDGGSGLGPQAVFKAEIEPLQAALAVGAPAPYLPTPIRRDPKGVIQNILEGLKLIPSTDVLALLKEHEYRWGFQPRPLKRDLQTGAPSLLLDALDMRVREFGVPLGALEDRTNPYGMVLLAPSGAGKTRKILQYLAKDKMMGYFMPYKTQADEKLGSSALASILDAAINNAPEGSRLRDRIEFGMECVLVAFQAVREEWKRKSGGDTDRQSAAWLLIQLYPVAVLGKDVFQTLALKLFEHCEGSLLPQVEPCACFIDEAQAISFLGEKLPPSMTRPELMRSALSAVLSGVSKCMGVEGIVAGTGFSLAKEFDTLRSQMAACGSKSWAYLEFPPLKPMDVKNTLERRLGLVLADSDENLGKAALWLSGRPRWVSSFIEKLITAQEKFTEEALLKYVKDLTEFVPKFNESASPRTPAQAFAKLRALAPVTAMPIVNRSHAAQAIPINLPPDRAVNDAWSEALHQAFLLTVGFAPQEVNNVVLSDLDIGYIQSVFSADDVKVKIELEPMVLESAWRHIQRAQPDYTVNLVVQAGDSESAMGDQFEYVVADRVLPLLVPPGRPLETSVFLMHERHGKWRRFIDPGHKGSPALLASVAKVFEGPWVRKESSFGRVALQEPRSSEEKSHKPSLEEGESTLHQEVYKWLHRFKPWRPSGRPTVIPEPTPSIFFPERTAGPDILMVVHRPDNEHQVMLVSVQVKLTKGILKGGKLSGPDTKDALFTVDPAKFYMENRTATGGTPVGDLAARDKFLKGLAEVPVIRMLVSGAAQVSKAETGFVRHHRAGAKYEFDLQLVVDQKDLMMDEVLGDENIKRIIGLKGLS